MCLPGHMRSLAVSREKYFPRRSRSGLRGPHKSHENARVDDLDSKTEDDAVEAADFRHESLPPFGT